MPHHMQQTRQFNTSYADTLTAKLLPITAKITVTSTSLSNSNTANKELNMALRANEQGDDAPLPAFKEMRLIN